MRDLRPERWYSLQEEMRYSISLLQYFTVLVYTKTTILLSIGGMRWIFAEPYVHHKAPPLR